HDHVRAQLVVARPDAGDPALFGQHPVDPDPGHDQRAGLLGLGRQPRVQLGAQHGDRVGRVGQPAVLVVDGHRAFRVEEVDVVAGDPALDGRLVEEAREDLLDAAGVQHAAGQVLAARRLAALDEQHRTALARQQVPGHAAGDAGADDDDVEVWLLHDQASAAVIAGTSWYRSPTRP